MNELLSIVLAAHGGLDAWRALHGFRGHMTGDSLLFERKGFPGAIADMNFMGRCHEQEICQWPFIRPGQRSVVRPDHVALENEADEIVLERSDPRSAFPADPAVVWNELNLAYFAGYALWNYLNAPFIFTLPGVETQEITPVQEGGETLRRLRVRYPGNIMTHSREETFYISGIGLIVRVDYAPEVTGGIPAANFASDHREVGDRLIMPTRRTVMPIGPDGTPDTDMVLVSIEIDQLRYV